MKIVIIGGGISGFTVYLELKKHLPKGDDSAQDLDIKIYEAYDTGKDVTFEDRGQGPTHSSTLIIGGGLGIAPNGLRVLQRLDERLLREVTRDGYVITRSNFKNKNGNMLMYIDSNSATARESGEASKDLNMVACSRHSFWRSLRTRIPDEDIITKRVSQVIANPEGRNLVHFVDESEPVEADIVIGADGVKSIAKRALFPEAAEDRYPPHYEGLVGIGGFMPATGLAESVEKGSMNFIFGGNGFFGYFYSHSDPSDPNRDNPYIASNPGETLAWWSTYEIKECPDRSTLDMDDVSRQLRERHAQWKDPVIQQVIKSERVTHMYPTWTSPPLPTWERDGVVLLGDAAHALPSTSGQGVSQALEDCESFVLFLAHQLKRTDPSKPDAEKQAAIKAARQYMELRKPRVTEILENSKRIQNSKRDMGVVREYAMYSMFKLLSFFPNTAAKPTRKLYDYDVAEEAAQMIASDG
ncbi:zeaxanthin epoxidase, chloroplastic [Trichoderma asperellum]|uniref:Zeaxanthin epoxidase, chloroplastic n=1 Tax=Trichoderma asperellum TaxID=101201 RepID=A0A6V8QKZ8_TRIAP|nr:FAD/NAD(P)-binding domain-containing protein [Trichoderma asperelloides]GFP52822.1 zeaxanthin epoxidase, chloroplastic [Trichoderma asperellum]